MEITKLYTKKALVFSIILFAISFVIGTIPLIATLIAYHSEISSNEKAKIRSRRIKPFVITLLILGYLSLGVIVCYVYF